MAQFNLNDYETVDSRIKRFYGDHPDGRIITKNLTTAHDREKNTWVVKAVVYFDEGSQAAKLPKATGFAFEIDGVGMANKTSALENAETSAIGRALANAGYSGDKRASREEMLKVQSKRDWSAELALITDEQSAMQLWNEARTHGAPANIVEAIKAAGKALAK